MNLNNDEVYVLRQSLLGGWFCIYDKSSEDEVLDKIIEILPKTLIQPPVIDKELIRDRLFGGFICNDDKNRRHVYFALGYYTFLNPEKNVPLLDIEREEIWRDLKSGGNIFLGGNNFLKGSDKVFKEGGKG